MKERITTDDIDLFKLAFSCYVYSNISGYDRTYNDLVKFTKGNINLENDEHIKKLLQWLNSWGCRQFSHKYFDLAIDSLHKWHKTFKDILINDLKSLLEIKESEIEDIGKAYEQLINSVASYRSDKIKVTIGPTGAAKILYALRPRALPPWDTPMRVYFGYRGNKESYVQYLYDTKQKLEKLNLQCVKHNFSINDLPEKIGKKEATLPKLLDEYYWITITRKMYPPDFNIVESWYMWSK